MRISDWSSDVCSSDLLAWPHLKRDWPVLRANWAIVALLGALAIGSFNILLYTGLQSTTALNSMLIQSALPALVLVVWAVVMGERRSEEHTSELQSLMRISYAVFCLPKKKRQPLVYRIHLSRDQR